MEKAKFIVTMLAVALFLGLVPIVPLMDPILFG